MLVFFFTFFMGAASVVVLSIYDMYILRGGDGAMLYLRLSLNSAYRIVVELPEPTS